jgi:D-psicose/D-tagatose/L-ribulose 3-epimerase
MTTESLSISRRNFLITLGAAALAARAMARTGSVEVGVCAKSADLENAVHYGFDYLEPSLAEISEMDDIKFAAFKARVLASPIRCESFNSFIRTLRVVGHDVDHAALQVYLERSLERASQLGGSVVVWGSAGSRNVPPGYSRERAWEQMKDFLRRAGGIAKSKGIVIAIEPLRKKESNIINTGAEALRLVRETGHPNVKMIIDYYHLREENEDPQIVWDARKEIVHFHFANPTGRLWPKDAGEDPLYGRFFALLKRIHFRGGISIEGRGTFASDAAASVEFFRRELA